MISRKKRLRYKLNAEKLSKALGISIDLNDWEAIWNLLDEHGEPNYLYAVGDPEGRVVKFGKSKEPRTRLGSIQTGTANKLYLWGYCKELAPLTERQVHARLREHKVSGEWFQLNAHVQEVVDEIRGAYAASKVE